MAAVAGEVGLDIVVANADLGSLVAFADHVEPPVARGIPAEVAHGRFPVIAADQIGDTQIHREQCGEDEQGPLMDFIFIGHPFGRFDGIAPLQLRERATGDIQRIALLIYGLLFDRAERIDFG
ncbi:hypothetical protein FQZ97_1201290 [compost metagenome]